MKIKKTSKFLNDVFPVMPFVICESQTSTKQGGSWRAVKADFDEFAYLWVESSNFR